MRKIFSLLLFFVIAGVVNAQFSMTVKIRTLNPVEVTLKDLDDKIIFSEKLKVGGVVEYSMPNIAHDLYNLSIGEYQQYVLLDNSAVVVKGILTDDISGTTNIKIEGSSRDTRLTEAEKVLKTYGRGEEWNLRGVIDNYDPMIVAALIYKYRNYYKLRHDWLREAIEKIPNDGKDALVMKSLLEMYQYTSSFEEGKVVDAFSLQNNKSEMVNLTDFKGKYLLLDFWASWCGPCIKEMENLKPIYDEVKDKNIEFISISLDDTKENWDKGLNKVDVPWVMLWDINGFSKSKFKDQFGFNQIPFLILLSPERKILARNLQGQDIKKEILKHIK